MCGEPEWERNCFYLFICMNPVTIWFIAWKENLPPLSEEFIFVGHGSGSISGCPSALQQAVTALVTLRVY